MLSIIGSGVSQLITLTASEIMSAIRTGTQWFYILGYSGTLVGLAALKIRSILSTIE